MLPSASLVTFGQSRKTSLPSLLARSLVGSAGAVVSEKVAIDHPDRVLTLGAFAGTGGIKHALQDQNVWVQRIGEKGLAVFLRESIADRVDTKRAPPGFVDWFIADACEAVAR